MAAVAKRTLCETASFSFCRESSLPKAPEPRAKWGGAFSTIDNLAYSVESWHWLPQGPIISNGLDQNGPALATGFGSATITATIGGVTAPTSLTVP
jgi:hypothetical protein